MRPSEMTREAAVAKASQWISAARAQCVRYAAALGAQLPSLDLDVLELAIDPGASLSGPTGTPPEIVEVAEWTDLHEVNAAIASGEAIILAAGYRDGLPRFVIGRFAPEKRA